MGDNSNDCTQESKELEDVKWMDGDENQGRKKSFLNKSWPSTDDPKRAGLLESIHAIFQLLIKHNHLVSSHLSKVIRYAVEVLQGLASGSQLLNSNMDQTPLCICFLGAPDLEKILGFLQEIVREIYHSEKRNIMGDSISGTQIVDTMEKITFTQDDLVLVLDEQSTMVKELGFEETYGGVTSHLCDLKSGEDDDWKTKDYLHKVDSCIEAAIQRQKDQVSLELCRIDARIVQIINWMQQLEVKLDTASAHDFRTILVPLVKSYLRTHLEDLAEKDTMKKFDADKEAFLAELALDSEQGFVGGGDSSSHMHERMKDKKKSKENRRNKDSKATGGNGLHMIRDQTSEGISQISAHDGDDPDAEGFFAGTDVVLKQQEEEYKHRIKLEFEERKVEETLEYERQIENEAKQKHLAEQPVSSEKENDLSTPPIETEKQEQLRVGKE
ncbi:Ubiquitin carboxyl-terminal hydrolase-related protein [Forsythia ovata]|uniref:Ubiquitin carboxyl-terminal hydrolase-related protein n=1 Tax=Forsythia ovata TaxID=205694 RepID=A0ABD1WVE6_9LAMI